MTLAANGASNGAQAVDLDGSSQGSRSSPDAGLEHDLAAEATLLRARCDRLLKRIDATVAAVSRKVSPAAAHQDGKPSTPAPPTNVRTRKERAELLEGVVKLQSMVRAEKRFLEKLLSDSSRIQPSHVQCSNLAFLEAVHHLASLPSQSVSRVFQSIAYVPATADRGHPSSSSTSSIRVDLVGRNGTRWIKVKASSLKGLAAELEEEEDDEDESSDEDDSSDNGSDDGATHRPAETKPATPTASGMPDPHSSSLPIFRQARNWLLAASQHPVSYVPPTIVFAFVLEPDEAVDPKIVQGLQTIGVEVEFHSPPADAAAAAAPSESPIDTTTAASADETELAAQSGGLVGLANIDGAIDMPLTQTLNLDTTCLIALVSDMSNRFHTLTPDAFDIPALQVQRDLETADPLFRTLLPIFTPDKTLITTRTAFSRFIEIVTVVGGPYERARAHMLFTAATAASEPSLQRLLASSPSSPQPLPPDEAVRAASNGGVPFGRVEVVADGPSARFRALAVSAAAASKGGARRSQQHQPPPAKPVSAINVAVFGTADALCATTVTANAGLVRALEQNGVGGVSAFVHGARSLVESRPSYSLTRAAEASKTAAVAAVKAGVA
ncbi:hypothetical protein DFJ73DRAFT_957485 [Zopfochytrium polystomum]|nr:hypothetical protein DFJ73DRAFT_957485 [Zopfochytrium polystomum]